MYPNYNGGQGNYTSRFGNVANEILRSSHSSVRPDYNQPSYQMGGYPQMGGSYGQPSYGSYNPSSMQVGNLQNLYQIKKLQDEIDQDKEDEEKNAYTDNLINIIDRQRGVLNEFLQNLTKQKDKTMKHQNKDIEREIRRIEKENVIRQIKINDEQAQLYRNLGAVYDFDPSPYQLSDVETDSEDEDDDVLLDILSNKVYFKKIQGMMNPPAKKKKKKKKKKKASDAQPTFPTDMSMSYMPMDDPSMMMRSPASTRKKKKKTKISSPR